jgi:hypothetical protein
VSAQRVVAQDPRVSETGGLSRSRLAWLQLTHRRGWAFALWLCLVAATAMPALLPLIGAMAVESQLVATLTDGGGLTVHEATPDVNAFAALKRSVDARVSSRTGAALVPLGGAASAGPLNLVTMNGQTVPSPTGVARVSAAFADDLADHVVVLAGQLPAEALGGGDTAVTLPQAGADQLGLRLSDRFCADLAGTATPQPRWCGRVVGLWQPLNEADPFWGGQTPRLQITMGRYDFFQLTDQLRPAQPAGATLRYWADPSVVDLGRAPSLAAQVRTLTGELRQPGRTVVTTLDTALPRFNESERAVSAAVQLLGAAVTLLGLFVVVLVGARFLDGQARELAILRARGWPRGRVWRVVAAGMAALAVSALPVGLALSALVLLALGLTGSGLSTQSLHGGDVALAGGIVLASAVALVAGLAILAARVVNREVEPSLEAPFRPLPTLAPDGVTVVLLAILGVPVLFLPRLPGVDQLSAGAPPWAAEVIALAPALGLVLLTGAAVRLYPLAWATPGRSGVGRTLAGWQLERRPEQHAGAAFVLILAAAVAIFAALGIVVAYAPDLLAGQPALRVGLQAGLLLGAAGGLALALAAYGLHFRSTTRRRLAEYGGLFAHGLPTEQLARSLAAEQLATARASLIVGTLLGLAMTLVVLPVPGLTPQFLVLALGAMAFAGICLLVGSMAVGSVARRLPTRIDPLSAGQS